MLREWVAAVGSLVLAVGVPWRAWQLWRNDAPTLDMFTARTRRSIPVLAGLTASFVVVAVPSSCSPTGTSQATPP